MKSKLMHDFEFGLDTPAQVTVNESGQELEGDQVIRNTIEEAVLADSVGIDSFDIGEHFPARVHGLGGSCLARSWRPTPICRSPRADQFL